MPRQDLNILWTWKIPPDTEPSRLERADRAIALALAGGEGGPSLPEGLEISRSRVQKLMEEGRVRVDGAVAEPKTRLSVGQTVMVEIPPPKRLELSPEEIPLQILYEDEAIAVINKPPGLSVHPSAAETEGTLVHALLHHIRDLSGIGGVLRPGIVHRLDKLTSGALVISKTDAAHQALAEVFSRHEIERRYVALCYGAAGDGDWHEVSGTIGRNPKDRKKMALNVNGGRPSLTRYRKREEYGRVGGVGGGGGRRPFASCVEAELHTGRTHQVRVHLTSVGLSLLGDPIYGTPSAHQAKWKALPRDVQESVEKMPGQALHARVLGFKHPMSGKMMRFEAPYFPEFENLLARLRGYLVK